MTKDRRSMIRAAEKLVSRGKLESAIKQYRKVLAAMPDDTTTLNRVGDLYVRINRLDEAVEIFSQAAEHFVEEGFLVKAIAIFKKIIRLDPTRIAVYETLADLYNRQGLRNEARSQYQVVADYFSQEGDSAKVRSIYERIVELEPSNPSHKVKLAELYCEASMIPEALVQYQRIASFMLEHERVDEALKVYRGAFDLSPSDLGFLTDVVLHLKDSGHPEAAGRLLAEAVERNPDAARVREVTGLVAAAPEAAAVEPAEAISPLAAPGLDALEGVPVAELLEAGAGEERLAEEPPPASFDVDAAVVGAADEAVDETLSSLALPETPPAEAASDGDVGVAEEDSEVLVLDLDSDAADLPFAVDAEQGARAPTEPAAEQTLDLDAEDAGLPFAVEGADALPELEEVSKEELDGDVERFGEQLVEAAEGVTTGPTETLEEIGAAESAEVGEAVRLEAATGELLPAEKLEEAASSDLEALESEVVGAEELGEGAELDVGEEMAPPAGGEVAAQAAAELAESVDDLMSEARMLTSYGLDAKAIDLCEQMIALDPSCLEAYDLLVDLRHDEGALELAADVAARAREAAGDGASVWTTIEEKIKERGYRVHADRISPPQEVVDTPVEPLVEFEPEPEQVAAEQGSPVWLESDASEEQSFAEAEEIFGAEDEFFDLAAELEQELQEEEQEISGEFLPQLQEQSLEEIVEGFKKGVAETLSEEDYETHYNLGIAYREMGLLDEAIGEFQLASKAPSYLVDCCSLLGSCFLEKGFPDLAIKWYERGLEAPQVTETESLGLLYELGNLYLITGDKEVAHKTFAEIYGINSNYRDVVAKLEELKAT